MSKIIVTISKKGKATVQVEGIQDSSCLKKTASLLKRLGLVRDERLEPDAVVVLNEGIKVG